MTVSGKGNEAFYIDEHGRESDWAVHEEILRGIDPEAEKGIQIGTAKCCAESGIDPHESSPGDGRWPAMRPRPHGVANCLSGLAGQTEGPRHCLATHMISPVPERPPWT